MDSTYEGHVSHRFSDFLMASSFFYPIIVLAACLQKTGGFACNWPLARANFASVFLVFASVWLSHPQFQRIFQTKYLGHCVLK
jgi:hypothetical protein